LPLLKSIKKAPFFKVATLISKVDDEGYIRRGGRKGARRPLTVNIFFFFFFFFFKSLAYFSYTLPSGTLGQKYQQSIEASFTSTKKEAIMACETKLSAQRSPFNSKNFLFYKTFSLIPKNHKWERFGHWNHLKLTHKKVAVFKN
jgi:hypothetical protein